MSKFIEKTKQALSRGHEFYAEALHDFTLMAARALGKDEDLEVNVHSMKKGIGHQVHQHLREVELTVTEYACDQMPQAAYGAAVRAMALNRGDFSSTEYRTTGAQRIRKLMGAGQEPNTEAAHAYSVASNEAENYAALSLAALTAPRIKKTLPGVGQAVLDSFLAGEPEVDLADLELSDELPKRLRAAWYAMVKEVLGDGLKDNNYPTPEWADTIKGVAEYIRENVAEVGQSQSLAKFIEDTFIALMQRLKIDEAKEDDANKSVLHGLSMENMGRAASEEEAQEEAKQEAGQAKRDGTGGQSSGDSKLEFASQQAGRGKPIEDTPLTDLIRPFLTDERRERVTGHYSGQLSQPGRIVTDLRVMSKKMVIEDTPDTMVVVLVDNSGSMGGPRWAFGTAMHDALVGALYKLEIPVCSAAFCQTSGQNITAVNAPGERPVQLGSVTCPQGGTGDLDAIAWATSKLDEYGKTGRVVVVISDNEGSTDMPKMKRMLKVLKADIVHIDLVGQAESQFGVQAIVAKQGKPELFAEPVGKAIRTALKLGDD